MRIGLIIKEFRNLTPWQLQIIREIINDPIQEIALLIEPTMDEKLSHLARGNKFFESSSIKSSIKKIILDSQTFVETKIFLKHIQINDRDTIIDKLNAIDKVKIGYEQKKAIALNDNENCIKLKNYNLDIIFVADAVNICENHSNLAKYGVWKMEYGKALKNGTTFAGFWEIYYKEPIIKVQLLELSSASNATYVLDTAYFNPHWSFAKTNNEVLAGSVSLLLKNLRIRASKESVVNSIGLYSSLLSKAPSTFQLLNYSLRFYTKLIIKTLGRLNTGLFGTRYHCWTLFIGKGNFLSTNLANTKPIDLPKLEFWADPFIFYHKNIPYVFFENYDYKAKKGKISCGIIDSNKVTDVVDILDFNYHLSYPFIFEEDGEIYLMPESSANKRLEIYKCINFPDQWELYSTAFEGEMVSDATIYNDKKQQKWLFINKKIGGTTTESELYIYKFDSLKFDNITAHSKNPVLIDSRSARNGGAIFEYNGRLLRPSQRNVEGIYGRALNIGVINKLTLDEYHEEHELTIDSTFQKGFKAIHHLHQLKDIFVFDAAYTIK